MKIQYSPDFYKQYKKAKVRIRKSFDERIKIFQKKPDDLLLNNHKLRKEYQGLKSIDITSDWRALFEEVLEGEDPIAYFVALGTHKDLYG